MAVLSNELEQLREQARATWSAGDYDAVSEPLWAAGGRVVAATGVAAGDRVLDVACGTGNAAVQAAQAGGDVTGLDLTPALLQRAGARAQDAGVEVEWVEGDAEDLPFEDGSFDVVLSTFGCMFAPRHQVVAAELSRVVRPGGRIGVCSWTPEGEIGEFFGVVGRHLPPAPGAAAASPLLWGTEDHIRELFADTGLTFAFERDTVEFRWPSPEQEVADLETMFGPLIKARELLEPQGTWSSLHGDLVVQAERHRDPATGASVSDGEYLLAVGRRP